MKSAFLKKTSGLLALMLLLSALAPVLAFAATGFKDVSYDNSTRTVKGQVYFADGEVGVGESVYVNVYDANGAVLGNVYAKQVGESVYGNTYYSFNQVIAPTSTTKITLNPFVWETVNKSVYSAVYHHITLSNGGNGGGGIYIPGGNVNGTINVIDSVNGYDITNAFTNNTTVTVIFTGDTVTIPVDALKEAAKKAGATLIVKNATGYYKLPLSVLDFDGLAKSAGEALKSLKLTIKKNATATPVEVDFSIDAIGVTGKTAALTSFGKTYVQRGIFTTTAADAKTSTVARKDGSKWAFVPSKFTTTEATFWSTTNSIYAVVVGGKKFADLAKHWSKEEVELLASKLVVEGVAADTFAPNRNITRAEFAALAVRSLGLTASTYSVTNNTYKFSDVAEGKWYTADVAAAAAAGIVVGNDKGKFLPDALITRQELAAMVVRAMAYAGKESNLTTAEQATALASFKDASKLTWAKEEVAAAVKAGVVLGYAGKVSPTANATRAEAASMLKRFLGTVGFID
ncbi:hypothetical protein SY83_13080 [Paenibacillus swuensis]|uniref:SLH domain-containing protein n=1 Tax=Paenibacillus swuensis TaxID=1178515 RepID=A0A172TPE1_9BACL|nr:S-layer homology domain-containing protein [Paenibacillus swuensis]ANE48908.1 hypothetical protein SY83_13080 [Paenibacillus swuensis]